MSAEGNGLLLNVPSLEIPFFEGEEQGIALGKELARAPRHLLADLGGTRSTAATSATSVVLLYSKKSLVVLFEVFSEPPLRVSELPGGPVFRDECVELFLADPDDAVSYLELVVNPAGSVYGARVKNPHDSRATWDLEPNRVPDGFKAVVSGEPVSAPASLFTKWTCLMDLPWQAFGAGRPPLPGETRRANCTRIARGVTTRFEALSPTGRSAPPDFHVPSRFARFVFAPASRTRLD